MDKISSAGYHVLFVQPSDKKNPIKRALQKIKDGLWLLSVPGLPYERCFYSVNWINGKIALSCVEAASKELGFEDPILWMDRVHGFDFSKYLGKSFVIYDLVDEITAFGRFRNEKLLLDTENKVLMNADLILTSSLTLLDRKIKQCGLENTDNCLFIPNGVDTKRFENVKPWAEIEPMTHPRIGFVGDLSPRRIDYPLVQGAVSKHPEWNFIFVGPSYESVKTCVSGDNVFAFEPVAGNVIPEIIASFDAAIVPYKTTEHNIDYVFPRKICEYLSSGKSVVSTALPEVVRSFPNVRVASTSSEFLSHLEAALNEKPTEEEVEMIRKKYDWDRILESLIKVIKDRNS